MDGPTLCFRGIDNAAYYRLVPGDPREYYDTTGCGNSLNAGDPITLQLFLDSLRYWIAEMHVDGFRFDLAPTLARQEGAFDKVGRVPGHRRAGSGGLPDQAGRRAVGRRPEDSYDLGPLPGTVAGVEQQVPRHDARFLAQADDGGDR